MLQSDQYCVFFRSQETFLGTLKGILHFLYFFLVVLPYYSLEAIVLAIFGRKESPKSVKGETVLVSNI